MKLFILVLLVLMQAIGISAKLMETGPVNVLNPVQAIITLYHKNNWEELYDLFSLNLQAKISRDTFRSAMYDVYTRLWEIDDHFAIDSNNLLTVHFKELDTAVFKYTLTANQQKFDSFVVSYAPSSTYSFFKKEAGSITSALSFWTPVGSVNINSDAMLSVCSVFKVTLVLEYARQVGEGILQPQVCIPLDYFNRYYLPHIDSGHKSFLDTVTGNCSKLDDMVIGMIKFSSNAIAEYLTDILTPGKVDQMIASLGMQHDPTMYVCSSMLALNNTKGLPYDEYRESIEMMTSEEIRQQSFLIHAALKDKTLPINDSFYLDPKVIDVHADLLEQSTTQSYLAVMGKIASGKYFPASVQTVIYRLFDAVNMQSPFAKKMFVHSGAKGGSANYPGMKNAALAVSGFMQLQSSPDKPRTYSMTLNGLTSTDFTARLLDMNVFITALAASDAFVTQFVRRLQS